MGEGHRHMMRLLEVDHQRFLFTPTMGRVIYTFRCEVCGQRYKVRKHELHPGHGLISMKR